MNRFSKWVKNGGIIVLAGLAAWGLTSVPSCVSKSRDLNDRVQRAYDLASGDDRVLSRDEEFKLYRDLGFTSTLHEGQNYYLDGNTLDDRVYLKRSGSEFSVGQLPVSKLYDYIAKREQEDFRR